MGAMPVAHDPAHGPARRRMTGLIAGAVLLVVAGGALFTVASQRAARTQAAKTVTAKTVTVRIDAKSCDPSEVAVPAGRVAFQIVNASERVVEWEILDGVMVVEERENIAPGMKSLLSADLVPGTYAMTCGLLTNPHGRLVVQPASDSAQPTRPALRAFIGALAEYQVYATREASALTDALSGLADAIRRDDVQTARNLFLRARQAYMHLDPSVERFGDLETAMNAPPDYFEKREEDPQFSGFYRLEWALLASHAGEALASAEKLRGDTQALQQRLNDQAVSPRDLNKGAAQSLDRIAEALSKRGKADPQGVLADADAGLSGVTKIVTLMGAIAAKSDPSLPAELQAMLADAVQAAADARRAAPAEVETEVDALAEKLRALSAKILNLNTAMALG